jgi:hypothetical protein
MEKKMFKQLVIKELNHLRENVPVEMLSELNVETLKPDSYKNCLYGQLTTNSKQMSYKNDLYPKSFELISEIFYNTNFIKFKDQDFSKGDRFTALEKYLYMVNSSKHKEIIDFIKKDSNKISITF